MLGLSLDHVAIAEGIASVSFSKCALSNEALGKRKRGALKLFPDTVLCTITTREGNAFIIRSNVNVDLVEINTRLENEPNLLETDPEAAGFICVGLTRGEDNLEKCFPNFINMGTPGFVHKSAPQT